MDGGGESVRESETKRIVSLSPLASPLVSIPGQKRKKGRKKTHRSSQQSNTPYNDGVYRLNNYTDQMPRSQHTGPI